MKAGLTSLDTMDMCHVFDVGNCDTEYIKFFIVQTVRQCASLRKIFEKATQNWKLLVLLSRIVLFRPPKEV